jgi:ribonuclease P protein component
VPRPEMCGARFQQPDRLLTRPQFDAVFSRSRRSADRWFTILYRYNKSGHARLGLALAKKRIRYATGRNRIKRLVRESFRNHRDDLPPVDLVVMARSEVVRATNRELFASLEKHWRQIGEATKKQLNG